MRCCLAAASSSFFLSILVCVFLAPSAAWAQAGTIAKGMQNNCANDYKKLCGEYGWRVVSYW